MNSIFCHIFVWYINILLNLCLYYRETCSRKSCWKKTFFPSNSLCSVKQWDQFMPSFSLFSFVPLDCAVCRHPGRGDGCQVVWGAEAQRLWGRGEGGGVQPAFCQLRRDSGLPCLRCIGGRQSGSRGHTHPLHHTFFHQQVGVSFRCAQSVCLTNIGPSTVNSTELQQPGNSLPGCRVDFFSSHFLGTFFIYTSSG